jgi:hypothetical protein
MVNIPVSFISSFVKDLYFCHGYLICLGPLGHALFIRSFDDFDYMFTESIFLMIRKLGSILLIFKNLIFNIFP